MRFYGCTDIGKVRSRNEDNLYINGIYMHDCNRQFSQRGSADSEVNLFAVFDGMGGENDGAVAAKIAAECLHGYRNAFNSVNIGDWDAVMGEYIHKANDQMEQIIARTRRNMGCTMALLIARGDTVKTYNMGDSRIYAFTNGSLNRLSRDHTVTAQLVDAGLLGKSEARHHRHRNKLTRHFGLPAHEFDLSPHVAEILARPGDIFILCSDGLTENCDDTVIERMLREAADDDNIAERLVNLALGSGSRDNITVVGIRI